MELDGVSDALQALKYSNAVEVVDEVLAADPAATVADVRRYAAVKKERPTGFSTSRKPR